MVDIQQWCTYWEQKRRDIWFGSMGEQIFFLGRQALHYMCGEVGVATESSSGSEDVLAVIMYKGGTSELEARSTHPPSLSLKIEYCV